MSDATDIIEERDRAVALRKQAIRERNAFVTLVMRYRSEHSAAAHNVAGACLCSLCGETTTTLAEMVLR